jgi:hypothetical protein
MQSLAVVALVALLGIALSVKSIIALGRAAPWTSAGWYLTIVYFVAVVVKATAQPALPRSAEYAVLVALAAAFVIAGVRDERQAEPWWWPTRLGSTRAEKRAGRAPVRPRF